MNCKSCNGIMELNKEKGFYFCPYCNSTEIIPDDLTPDEIKDIVSEEVKKSGKKAKKDFEKDVTKIVKKTMAETETTKSSFKDILLAILLLVMAGFFLIMMLFGFSTEYKLFGFFSMLQFALAVTAFVMLLAKRNAMTRKIKLTIILLIVSCVFLMPVAVVCGMNADSNSSSSYQYTWMSIGMAEKVPEPEAKLTFFTTSNKNASFHFSDYKSGYAESYIALCKEKGFNIDIYVQDSNFIAYDENDNKLPKALVACVGGGSNSIGLFSDFIDEKDVDIYGVEAAGLGLDSEKHSSAIAMNKIGIMHGMKTYIMQKENGEIIDAYSISAGLDYPGIGPDHASFYESGRVKYVSITDNEAVEAFKLLSKLEGIIPALESSHAIAYALKISKNYSPDDVIVVNLSGRGDKDLDIVFSTM